MKPTSSRISKPRAALCVLWVLWLCLSAAGVAAAGPLMNHDEALQALQEAGTSRQQLALRILESEALPGDEAALVPLTTSADDDTAAAALRVLAKLWTDDAKAALDTALRGPSQDRRELAALAVLLAHVDLDEQWLTKVKLQLVSEQALAWLAARDQVMEGRALQAQNVEKLQTLRDLVALSLAEEDPCLADGLRAEGVVLERFVEGAGFHLESSWREGRLTRIGLELELLRRALEVQDPSAIAARCELLDEDSTRLLPPVDPYDPYAVVDPYPPEIGEGRSRFAALVEGRVGQDNHTFQLRPGLRVTEPGPSEGAPIDLVRDDTFTRAALALLYSHTYGGTVFDSESWRGYGARPNHLSVALTGAWNGRRRWGQLQGADGRLSVHSHSFLDPIHTLEAQLDGGLEQPNWREESELGRFTNPRFGGSGKVRWASLLNEPTRLVRALDVVAVEYAFEGYGFVGAPFVMDPFVEGPETWFTGHRVRAEWLPIWWHGSPAAVGGFAEAGARWSDSDHPDGVQGIAGAELRTQLSSETDLRIAVGYTAAFPFSQGAAQSLLWTQPYEVGDDWLQEPFAEAELQFLDRVQGEDFKVSMGLTVSHGLELGGRTGWVAIRDVAEATAVFETSWGADLLQLTVQLDRARSPLGRDADGADLEVEIVSAGAIFEFPLAIEEELFVMTLLTDVRWVSDTSRFDGESQGQVRVQAVLRSLFEL